MNDATRRARRCEWRVRQSFVRCGARGAVRLVAWMQRQVSTLLLWQWSRYDLPWREVGVDAEACADVFELPVVVEPAASAQAHISERVTASLAQRSGSSCNSAVARLNRMSVAAAQCRLSRRRRVTSERGIPLRNSACDGQASCWYATAPKESADRVAPVKARLDLECANVRQIDCVGLQTCATKRASALQISACDNTLGMRHSAR